MGIHQFAIYRTQKLKTQAHITAMCNEHGRRYDVPNANSNLRNKNQTLHGDIFYRQNVDKLLDQVNATVRKDAVLAFDFVMTASPEFFEKNPVGSKGFKKWQDTTMDFLKKEYGDNLAYACLHLDEKTPHIQGMVVPLQNNPDGTIGLNTKRYLDNGGKGNIGGKLNQVQDRVGEAFKELGLKRGIKGSKATHKKIRTFYAELKAKHPKTNLSIEDVQLSWMGTFGGANKSAEATFKKLLAKAKTTKMLEEQIINLEAQNEKLAKENTSLKEQAFEDVKAKNKEIDKQLRALDLDDVIAKFGLTKHQKYGTWSDPNGTFKIEITDGKFYDFKNSKGGRGAFDLVKHLNDWDFQQARQFLASTYGYENTTYDIATKGSRAVIEKQQEIIDRAAAEIDIEKRRIAAIESQIIKGEDVAKIAKFSHDAEEVKKPFNPSTDLGYVEHPKDEKTWPKIRNFLTKIRGIPERIIDELKDRNLVYSDKRNNIVWPYENGAVLHGTSSTQGKKKFRGFAAGSKRNRQWEWSAGSHPTKLAIVCENPLDGISLAKMGEYQNFTIISQGGATDEIPHSIAARPYDNILIAYDNDSVGQKMGYALENKIKHIQRKAKVAFAAPVSGTLKDWNDVLQSDPSRSKLFKIFKDSGLTPPVVAAYAQQEIAKAPQKPQEKPKGFKR